MRRELRRHFSHTDRTDNLPISVVPRSRGRAAGVECLAKVMQLLGVREGVEVGTNKGISATIWCQHNPQMHLTCIDPYMAYRARPRQEEQDQNYAEACQRLKDRNVTLRREFSLDAVRTFADESLDFVFIDGDHRFDHVMQDIICWLPKVRKGGLVTIHDYCVMNQGGVMAAINAYVECHRIDPWYVTQELTPTAFWQKGAERL